MAWGRVITAVVLIGALASSPVFAQEGRRRGSDRRGDRTEESRGRAVPRDSRQYDNNRDNRHQQNWRNDNHRSSNRTVVVRPAPRPYYYANRGYYNSHRAYVPRVIRPTIVTVAPYRPFVYRPRLSFGVYYGAGGAYPYGYTPRGYYDPIPGRVYGGLRITGAPREAHVFADGYYVGIVNDFDGVFQHLNLEAGGHTIEVEIPGYDRISFDVMVQPGRTVTLRADVPY